MSYVLLLYTPHVASGVFLGEAAQTLIQNVDYEIPFLRKQAARFDQQVIRHPLGIWQCKCIPVADGLPLAFLIKINDTLC